MDGGAWWAPIHGVAKSRTRLSNFTFFLSFFFLCTWPEAATFGNPDPKQESCLLQDLCQSQGRTLTGLVWVMCPLLDQSVLSRKWGIVIDQVWVVRF